MVYKELRLEEKKRPSSAPAARPKERSVLLYEHQNVAAPMKGLRKRLEEVVMKTPHFVDNIKKISFAKELEDEMTRQKFGSPTLNSRKAILDRMRITKDSIDAYGFHLQSVSDPKLVEEAEVQVREAVEKNELYIFKGLVDMKKPEITPTERPWQTQRKKLRNEENKKSQAEVKEGPMWSQSHESAFKTFTQHLQKQRSHLASAEEMVLMTAFLHYNSKLVRRLDRATLELCCEQKALENFCLLKARLHEIKRKPIDIFTNLGIGYSSKDQVTWRHLHSTLEKLGVTITPDDLQLSICRCLGIPSSSASGCTLVEFERALSVARAAHQQLDPIGVKDLPMTWAEFQELTWVIHNEEDAKRDGHLDSARKNMMSELRQASGDSAVKKGVFASPIGDKKYNRHISFASKLAAKIEKWSDIERSLAEEKIAEGIINQHEAFIWNYVKARNDFLSKRVTNQREHNRKKHEENKARIEVSQKQEQFKRQLTHTKFMLKMYDQNRMAEEQRKEYKPLTASPFKKLPKRASKPRITTIDAAKPQVLPFSEEVQRPVSPPHFSQDSPPQSPGTRTIHRSPGGGAIFDSDTGFLNNNLQSSPMGEKSPDAAAERKEKPKISIANLATVSSHYTKRVTTVGGGSGEYLSKTKYRKRATEAACLLQRIFRKHIFWRNVWAQAYLRKSQHILQIFQRLLPYEKVPGNLRRMHSVAHLLDCPTINECWHWHQHDIYRDLIWEQQKVDLVLLERLLAEMEIPFYEEEYNVAIREMKTILKISYISDIAFEKMSQVSSRRSSVISVAPRQKQPKDKWLFNKAGVISFCEFKEWWHKHLPFHMESLTEMIRMVHCAEKQHRLEITGSRERASGLGQTPAEQLPGKHNERLQKKRMAFIQNAPAASPELQPRRGSGVPPLDSSQLNVGAQKPQPSGNSRLQNVSNLVVRAVVRSKEEKIQGSDNSVTVVRIKDTPDDPVKAEAAKKDGKLKKEKETLETSFTDLGKIKPQKETNVFKNQTEYFMVKQGYSAGTHSLRVNQVASKQNWDPESAFKALRHQVKKERSHHQSLARQRAISHTKKFNAAIADEEQKCAGAT